MDERNSEKISVCGCSEHQLHVADMLSDAVDDNVDDKLPLYLQAQHHQQRQQLQQQALLYATANDRYHKQRESAGARIRSVVGSTGTGFVYGAMLGSVLATVNGLRAAGRRASLSLQLHSVAFCVRTEAPRSAGHVALVTCAFRLTSLGLAELRRVSGGGRREEDSDNISASSESGSRDKEDLWGVLLTAPIAGAALHMHHGPRAALYGALSFGSVGAVMLAVHAAERAVERRWPETRDTQDGEMAAWEDVASEASEVRRQQQMRLRAGDRHHSGAVEAREVLEEIAFAEELEE